MGRSRPCCGVPVKLMRSEQDPRRQANRPVPRHARGGTGGGREHARRLSPAILRIFRNSSPATAKALPASKPKACGTISLISTRARLQIIERGAAPVGDAAICFASAAERAHSQRRSRRQSLSRPEARGRGLPKVLSMSDVDPSLLARAKALGEAPDTSSLHGFRAVRLYCLLEVLLRHRPAVGGRNW